MLLDIGDYVFSIPDVNGWRKPAPIKVAEVVSCTKTRATLDNGVVMLRQAHGGGPYGNWMQNYGFSNDQYDFIKERKVGVRRADFPRFSSYAVQRRKTEYDIKRLEEGLDDLLRSAKTVEELQALRNGLLTDITKLLNPQP
jgi:hypothetical protein